MYDMLEQEELRKLFGGEHWNAEDVAIVFGEMLQNCSNTSCEECPLGHRISFNGNEYALVCNVLLDYRKKSKTNS